VAPANELKENVRNQQGAIPTIGKMMYPLFIGTLFSLLFIQAIQNAEPCTGVFGHVMRRDGCAAMITKQEQM
jgi:hypothetical protein